VISGPGRGVSSSDPAGPGEARKRRRQRIPPSAPFFVAIGLACWLTGLLAVNLYGSNSPLGGLTRVVFPQVGRQNLDTATVDAAWDTVRQQYWRRDVSSNAATQGAVSGIVDGLHTTFGDRFTAFYTASQYKELQDSLNGKRTGSVGIELEPRCAAATLCADAAKPTVVAIVGVLHGQPADKAGIQRGDILAKVDHKVMTDFGADPTTQINNVGNSIRGEAGSSVVLTVERAGQRLDIAVTRADLNLPSVFSQRFGHVVDVEVTSFSENTGDDVRKALADGFAAGATGVVLDLRHNPGGLVTEAQTVASQFLAPTSTERDVVIRRGRIDGSDPSTAQTVVHDAIKSGGVATTQKLAIIVDGDSASAAEIVAAAIHDYRRGEVVGEKTFGKGSVQQDFALPDGSDLHLTVEKWYGPGGESIDGTGIAPDMAVTLPNADDRFRLDAQSVDPTADPQLQRALALVGG
jgi:carboxyl-terminal processing protease